MFSCIWGDSQTHLHKSPLLSALPPPAHVELGKLHPRPGYRNRKLAPSTKAANIQARCAVGFQLLQMFTH